MVGEFQSALACFSMKHNIAKPLPWAPWASAHWPLASVLRKYWRARSMAAWTRTPKGVWKASASEAGHAVRKTTKAEAKAVTRI